VYTDCVRFVEPVSNIQLGNTPGTYKQKVWQDVIVEENRIDAYSDVGHRVLKAPGYTDKARETYLRRMHLVRVHRKGLYGTIRLGYDSDPP
jgi:hypothetical protein